MGKYLDRNQKYSACQIKSTDLSCFEIMQELKLKLKLNFKFHNKTLPIAL